MKLIFENGAPGRRAFTLPELDVPAYSLQGVALREKEARLPEVSEIEVDRHYSALERRTHGINNGIYLLGSCTMKYNPQINEIVAAWPGFAGLHPLQEEETCQGALEVYELASQYLNEICGMEQFTFQPAAGSHGEFTGLLMIKKYHESRGDTKRTRIFVPDAAHGTNPASAAMAGFTIVSIPDDENGEMDLEILRREADDRTAGLMLTNPNTEGVFNSNVLEMTSIVHEAGGLCYYDGANLNAIMGTVRPGDMGFDTIHLNLHKTFSTPHGGGGPGSGATGVGSVLRPFLPNGSVVREGAVAGGASGSSSAGAQAGGERPGGAQASGAQVGGAQASGALTRESSPQSIGRMRSFHGNFLVVVRALTYLMTLGKKGIPEAARNAVLNANYLKSRLEDTYDVAHSGLCMHEFVLSLEKLKKETGVSALDVAKGFIDYGMHPPTMYFPMTVPEALMIEPTETETKETLDQVADAFLDLWAKAHSDPDYIHGAPYTCPVRRPDEVKAARQPVIRYEWPV